MAPNPSSPSEFRRKIVDLVRSGRPASPVAQDFQPSPQTISYRCQQGDFDSGRRFDVPKSAENEKISRRRKRVRQLEIEPEIEPEILSKASGRRNRSTQPSGHADGGLERVSVETARFVAAPYRALQALESSDITRPWKKTVGSLFGDPRLCGSKASPQKTLSHRALLRGDREKMAHGLVADSCALQESSNESFSNER